MAYNTKAIKTDVNGNPISQYYNPETDEYEPVEGAGGGNKVIIYNEDGTPNNSLNFGEILDKLDQLKGTVIDEETRKQNEQTRQQNEQQRIDLYNTLKDLDVSQYELRLQKLEHDTSVEEFILEEAYGPVIPLPENVVNGQINEIKIFGNTKAEEDNVKSTICAIRFKGIGRNLFDGELELGLYDYSTGLKLYNENCIRSKNFIKVQPNTIYTVSNNRNYNVIVYYYDDKKRYLGYGTTNPPNPHVFTTPENCYYIAFRTLTSLVQNNLDTLIQVEKGIQATEYEPYKESTLYILGKDEEGNILELRSLPNGVKDEIRLADGKAIIRTSKLTIDGTESGWQTQSTSNQKILSAYISVANLQPLAGDNLSGQKDSVILEGFTTGIAGTSNTDNINTVNYNETGVNLIIDIALERLETPDISGFKKWLGEKQPTLIYQLAEPEIIPIEVFGNLQSYENGTVYIDTIVSKVNFYDGQEGITVTVPIKAIDTLYKVDKETGYLHPLDISQAVIAEDRMSFTHPELADGDLVDWDYVPDVESTNPAISMKLPTNLKASINSNVKKIGDLSNKVDNLNIRMVAIRKNIQDVQNEFNEHKEEFNTHKADFNTHKADFKEYKQIYIPSYIKGNKMKYIGHRGVAMIAPENTIPSFEKAGELGFWATEADCIVTKDGEWVIFHDTTVDRMTNGTGNIQDMTLSQVRGLTIDAGANIELYPNLRIPTLEEFLDACLKWNLVPIVETKGTVNASNLQSLIDSIKAKGLINKVIISSLSLSHLTEIRNIDKNVFVEYAVYNFNSSVIDTLKALGNAMLSLPYASINQSIMYQCFANNILVSAWTVNDYNIAKSLEKLGVAQIYSDILC